jgi:hypothetical protein
MAAALMDCIQLPRFIDDTSPAATAAAAAAVTESGRDPDKRAFDSR